MTKATLIRTATFGGAGRHDVARPADAGQRRRSGGAHGRARRPDPRRQGRRSSSRSASARASSSTCRATSRTCWSPIPRSPTRSCAPRAAPTSSASRSARPTSISSTPKAGSSMAFDIAVTRDLNGIRAALQAARCRTPTSRVEGLADGIVLTGSVASPAESQQAFDIASRLAGDGNKVVNGITVRGRDQVMLKVTVAEVQRDVIKQLGIDLTGSARLRHSGGRTSPTPTRSRRSARRWSTPTRITGDLSRRQRDVARDGARRRHPHAGRAEPDRDLRRNRELPGRRRISDPGRLHLRPDDPQLPDPDPVQEVRRRPELHAGGDVGGPHQPQGADRSVRAVERQRADADAVDQLDRDHDR